MAGEGRPISGPGSRTPPGPNRPPGVWAAASPPLPPLRPPPRRTTRRGCGLAYLLAVVAVIAVLFTGLVLGVQHQRNRSPAHRRAVRIDELRSVCDGKGIGDVPAYRRGGDDQLGARLANEAADERDDDPEDIDVVAFTLVPGREAEPEAVLDARVMACTTSAATKQERCSFTDPAAAPGLTGGRVTAVWTTLTTTTLRIVDVHSGRALQTSTFETPSECPNALAVRGDGSYDARLPLEQIGAQTEAQVALFHQG